MIPRTRAPRVRRSTFALILTVAALAFPLGVLANHQFSDVPTAASYHDDVEALVNAGVTTGCGGGKYCPNEFVTRGQMAQFLNRLGDLDGSSAASVNADTVDGLHGSAFHRYGANAPALTTQRGAWAAATGDGELAGEGPISFPVPLGSVPTVEVIQYGDTGSANCAGSASNPTAAGGFLCIYVGWNLSEFLGGTEGVDSYDPADGFGDAARFGSVVFINDSGDADNIAEASGTWAVTAPLVIIPFDESTEDDTSGGSAK